MCAEMSNQGKVLKILQLPSGPNDRMVEWKDAQVKPFDRRRLHTTSEYHPDLVKDIRQSTKVLSVSQPDGPSFQVSGNLITWEKWRMRIGFNYVSFSIQGLETCPCNNTTIA
jgi:primary-amine oxidase